MARSLGNNNQTAHMRPAAEPKRASLKKPAAKLSSKLEEDAQDMEARLHQLRSNLLEEKQKLDAERPAKYGGSRWRSASENRGSIRKYAEEVHEKGKGSGKSHKSKNNDPKSSDSKNPAAKNPQAPVLSPATVLKWSTEQVLQWLNMLELDEFEGPFEFHQVDGPKLLALTAVECAGFGVAKLSVRNRLLAEIEALRSRVPVSGDQQQQQSADIIDPTIRDAKLAPEQAPKHWSHLTPLSEKQVDGGEAEAPVNLADGGFDEDASHASFMKALLEWRSTDSEAENQGEWVNPLGSEAAEAAEGGALLEGSYDEAKAHESFRLAVEAWRHGDVLARPGTSERSDSGSATSARRSCWQCYRVASEDALVADEQRRRFFCSVRCQDAFRLENARLFA